ncbi:MAG: acryloyl-CoA reductase [Actinomycetota bacterium]|jgi:acrylyl-CoA reductase (NADPH)
MSTVRAFTVGKSESGWTRNVTQLSNDALGDGDVLIRVQYSGINFKDGLVGSETGRVARIDPIVPGIDLAGVVVESADPAIAVGSSVLAHGYDIGVAHHGGYAQFARIPSAWIVPMPAGLDARTAMMVGTAGYTAALSVDALERAGLVAGAGPVLVTGATGGVGSMAVGMLAARGHEVVASTGKSDQADWLRSLGASEVIDRAETSAESTRPLERERWAGSVDCVGGSTLAYVLRTLRYGASVAASGLTGGTDLGTTVHPFILRGVNLLGIDSVQTPLAPRIAMWQRIATDLRPTWLDTEVAQVIGLDQLPAELDRILVGGMRGRVLVDPQL